METNTNEYSYVYSAWNDSPANTSTGLQNESSASWAAVPEEGRSGVWSADEGFRPSPHPWHIPPGVQLPVPPHTALNHITEPSISLFDESYADQDPLAYHEHGHELGFHVQEADYSRAYNESIELSFEDLPNGDCPLPFTEPLLLDQTTPMEISASRDPLFKRKYSANGPLIKEDPCMHCSNFPRLSFFLTTSTPSLIFDLQ